MGRAVAITRKDYSAADLRALSAKSGYAAKARRLLAIAMSSMKPHGLMPRD